jgi:DNA-binding transcriptional LysR family regulator
MPRSFDVAVDSPASVDQVHAAFSAEQYWLARLATLNGSTALESLTVDDDRTVRVATTQDLGSDLLPGIVAKFYRRDLKVRHTETWTPSGDQLRGEITVAVSGAPGTGRCAQRQFDALQHHRVFDRVGMNASHGPLSHHRVQQWHVEAGERRFRSWRHPKCIGVGRGGARRVSHAIRRVR